MPPSLEEFIPGERLPEFIDIYVDEKFLFGASGLIRSTLKPIKFVRKYPPRTIDNKSMFYSSSLLFYRVHDMDGSKFCAVIR
jgi:hypothetical protein